MGLVQRVRSGELDTVGVGSEPDMVVGVDEAGQQQASPQVHHPGVGPGERPELRLAADPGDPAVPHGDRPGGGPGRVDGVDARVHQQ